LMYHLFSIINFNGFIDSTHVIFNILLNLLFNCPWFWIYEIIVVFVCFCCSVLFFYLLNFCLEGWV
jgi:hypothetical protein